jgi:hypothetical protein
MVENLQRVYGKAARAIMTILTRCTTLIAFCRTFRTPSDPRPYIQEPGHSSRSKCLVSVGMQDKGVARVKFSDVPPRGHHIADDAVRGDEPADSARGCGRDVADSHQRRSPLSGKTRKAATRATVPAAL